MHLDYASDFSASSPSIGTLFSARSAATRRKIEDESTRKLILLVSKPKPKQLLRGNPQTGHTVFALLQPDILVPQITPKGNGSLQRSKRGVLSQKKKGHSSLPIRRTQYLSVSPQLMKDAQIPLQCLLRPSR